eukprot:UN13651
MKQQIYFMASDYFWRTLRRPFLTTPSSCSKWLSHRLWNKLYIRLDAMSLKMEVEKQGQNKIFRFTKIRNKQFWKLCREGWCMRKGGIGEFSYKYYMDNIEIENNFQRMSLSIAWITAGFGPSNDQ